MSVIGPGNIASLNLAGSLAGAQRTNAADGEQKADAADRRFQLDQRALSAKSLGDVAETDRSADRDADGRTPYQDAERTVRADDKGRDEPPRSLRAAADAFGERGSQLDLEA